MHTQYIYSPTPANNDTKWHSGWNSCLIFLANLLLLTFYAIVPGIPFAFILASVSIIASAGIISAIYNFIFGKFWLCRTYATCGLIGNVCVVLWLLLSL